MRAALVWVLKSRLSMTVLLPAGLVLLAVVTFFAVLLGRWEQRREIARAMSRVLSGTWDGQGDCSFSAWSYFMVLRGKRWGPWRVRVVNALNADPQHCQDAYSWHEQHKLFDRDEIE